MATKRQPEDEIKSNVMTVKDLAEYLSVHPSTIYRQLKLKQIPAYKIGSDWRFNRESIDKWRIASEEIQ